MHRCPIRSARFFTSTVPGSTETSPDVTNRCHTKLRVDIDVASITGTSVTVTVQGKNEEDGTYYTLLADAAISAAGESTLEIDPTITTVTANETVAKVVPRVFRISVAKSSVTALSMTARYTLSG